MSAHSTSSSPCGISRCASAGSSQSPRTFAGCPGKNFRNDVGNSNPAPDHRKNAKHDQRNRHAWRRFMRMHIVTEAALAPEGPSHQTRHVESGQGGAHRADQPEKFISEWRGIRHPENLVLTEEAGKRRQTDDRDPAEHEREVSDRQIFLKSTHLANVLFFVHGMNDAS